MVASRVATLFNPQAVPLSDVPLLDSYDFRQEIGSRTRQEGGLSALFGIPQGPEQTRLFAVIGDPSQSHLAVCSTIVGSRYEALSTNIPQAQYFERKIAEQWGIIPEGHPHLQPIRFHPGYRAGLDAGQRNAGTELRPALKQNRRSTMDDQAEVVVGPLLPGTTESGQFRIQCDGDTVLNLDVQLGYQYRAIEQVIIGGPNKRTMHLVEMLAGDTTIGHATAYAHALEELSGTTIPMRAQVIRGIALEVERLARHTGDLGELAQEVGFLPAAGACGRLCSDFQDIMAALCGNRLGRSLIRPGGVGFDLEPSRIDEIQDRVTRTVDEVGTAAQWLWHTPSVQSRFEDCGVLASETCVQLGLVGPLARACGREIDVRHDFPSGIYRYHQVAVSTVRSGDVFGRAFVRWLEIQRSADCILEQLSYLERLKVHPVRVPLNELRPGSLVLSLVEGWRGEICHVGITDSEGHLADYKICDPSFHNLPALAVAAKGQPISDFSLIHKSLNLSASGHDL